MQPIQQQDDAGRYAKCIEVSKRIRWDIERDVIRGRRFDYGKSFLPSSLSLVDELPFLTPDQKRQRPSARRGHYDDQAGEEEERESGAPSPAKPFATLNIVAA